MSSISPLDVRVNVLTQPLITPRYRAADQIALGGIGPVASSSSTARVDQVFQKNPKPEKLKTPLPAIVRKGEELLIGCIEALKQFVEKLSAQPQWDPYPPRVLQVPTLPYPHFETEQPARFFWHAALPPPHDGYAPACLMAETKESEPENGSAKVLDYARHQLPQIGVLRKSDSGFIYLELSDRYTSELPPLMEREETTLPPACIPVMTPQEYNTASKWGEIKELDQSFSFDLQGFYALKPKRLPGVEEVYFLSLHSVELENLRERYLLPKKIYAHDFHVVVGLKPEKEKAKQKPEIFRLNVSCFAA